MSAFLDRPRRHSRQLPYYEADFRLAQLAAPFVVAGMAMPEALSKALELLGESNRYLSRWEWNDIMRRADTLSTVGIEGALRYLGISDPRMLRRWLTKAHGEAVAADLWPRALKGEAVFSPEIWKPMKAAQTRANKAKGPKVAKKSENMS